MSRRLVPMTCTPPLIAVIDAALKQPAFTSGMATAAPRNAADTEWPSHPPRLGRPRHRHALHRACDAAHLQPHLLRQQRLVAFARAGLQPLEVDDLHRAAAIADDAL